MLTTYKINRYIELKLENDITNIYVNGKEFTHCKYILMNIDTTKEKPDHTLISIDELKSEYSTEHENNKCVPEITPEVEFFAHCSNLEAWYNNDYNPNLLHTNLSIPLLRELVLLDVNVFSSLMYHLDNYWIAYESEYDKRFTYQRRMNLIEQYKEIVYEAIEKHNLEISVSISIFLTNLKLLDTLTRAFPLQTEYCDFCNDKKRSYIDNEHQFYDVDIHNNPFDLSDKMTHHICYDCYENIYDADIEYCSECGNYFANDYTMNIVYVQEYEGVYCSKCLNIIYLESGIPEVKEYDTVRDFSLLELQNENYRYIGSIKFRDVENDENVNFVNELIKSGKEILIQVDNDKYLYNGVHEKTLGILMRLEKPLWNFKLF